MMTGHVVLLRAINVGGKNRLPMAELRNALTAAGLQSVSTYVQSGNVLLSSDETELAIVSRIHAVVAERFALDIDVIVRSAVELAEIARRNPFLETDSTRDPATLHVAFLAERPTDAAVTALDPDRSPPDACIVDGREVYLSYPNGSGRSRLTLDYLERTLGCRGTARNWRTVQRLVSLLEER